MDADRIWEIVVECDGEEAGPPIPCCGWDVLSKLAAVRSVLPAGWEADAFPDISSAAR
jgi:hypothetical protein